MTFNLILTFQLPLNLLLLNTGLIFQIPEQQISPSACFSRSHTTFIFMH